MCIVLLHGILVILNFKIPNRQKLFTITNAQRKNYIRIMWVFGKTRCARSIKWHPEPQVRITLYLIIVPLLAYTWDYNRETQGIISSLISPLHKILLLHECAVLYCCCFTSLWRHYHLITDSIEFNLSELNSILRFVAMLVWFTNNSYTTHMYVCNPTPNQIWNVCLQ